MAKLKYTLNDYISSPSGKGSAVNTGKADKQQYEKELAILENSHGKITYEIYKQNNQSKITYYIKFKVPSNSTEGFFNDVVFELTPNKDDATTIRTIRNYYIKFFCNDYNFVYTYAYAFKSHGVFISGLEKKLPIRAMNYKATTRNPDNSMGYNKSIYFCYLVMERSNLFDKKILTLEAKPGGLTKVQQSIVPFDKKEQERKKLEDKQKLEKQKARQTPKNKIVKSKSLQSEEDTSLKPRLTKVIGTVKNSKITKSVKNIKRR